MSTYYTTQEGIKDIDQMVACARREFNMRKRVYPRWIEAGKLTAEKAQHEIDCMEAIYYTLYRIKELQEASQEMIAEEEKRQKLKEQPQLGL